MKDKNSVDPSGVGDFRKNGHMLVDMLADYLESIRKGVNVPVLPWQDPDELAGKFSFHSGGGADEPYDVFMKRVIDNSIHLHHPRYIGHQVTSPLPMAALTHLCTALLNNASAVYEMGPVSIAMEHNVVGLFGKLIGYSDGFDGIFTHGGTAGNLTALLAARQSCADYDIWKEGTRQEAVPGFIMSEHSHYSLDRSVKIMGLGEKAIIKVPVDNMFRMDASLLGEAFERAADIGIKPIVVCASACSTAAGKYDDLVAIGEFCDRHGLWMHVDGAHGLGVLLSEKHRHLAKGIERADSIVIDFHKMFLVPALNTLVMFRNSEASYGTFAQKASYLLKSSNKGDWYESAARTLECTKSSLGVIAYTALKYYRDYYSEYIDSRYALAHRFASSLEEDPELEAATMPESNIVCFRYVSTGLETSRLNEINQKIREEIIKDGSFYIVRTELDGKVYLRVTIINPSTSFEDLAALSEKVKNMAGSM